MVAVPHNSASGAALDDRTRSSAAHAAPQDLRSRTYDATRDRVEGYFDRTATRTWERLTSDAPVSRVRQTVREGRDTMRAAMLDAIGHPYVNTAVSKGLTDGQVAKGHILRNAMIPLITVLGLEIAGLLNGSIFVEAVFSLPGVGRVLVDAVEGRDFPVLQFGLIAYALIVVLVNLVIDLCYVIADPRIRLDG